MHFVSSDADMIDYARTGQGTDKMSAVEGGAATLGDHTATWGATAVTTIKEIML